MSLRVFGIGLYLAAGLWIAGCGGSKTGKYTEEQMKAFPLANRYDLPPATGNMVMRVGSQTITSEEILVQLDANELLKLAAEQMDQKTFIGNTRPFIQQRIRDKVADILLYEEARKKSPENIEDALDKAVDQEISMFIAGYGNDYALAEAQIRKEGWDWRTFREYQKKLIMTHSYLSGKLKEKVLFTHSQMMAYYNAVRDEQFCRSGKLEFHAIDILPKLLAADRIGEGQTAQQAAMELAAALAARAQAGEEFAELAKTYSHGPLAKTGGKWLPVTLGANSLPQPYDILETEAVKLQPGQVSEPIVNADHIFILKLDSKDMGGCKSFEEVQPLIERQLLFKHQQQQYEEYISKLMRQAGLVELDRFTEFCTNAAYDRWKNAG